MGEIKSLEVPLECPICRSAPQIENRPATAISWVGVSIVHCCDLSIGADDEIAAISHWNTLCLGYRRALAAIPAAEAEAAALRAKVARLEEKAVLWIEQGMVIVAPESVPQRMALESYRKQFAELVRAALTDGGKDG